MSGEYISREAAINRLNENLRRTNTGSIGEACYSDAINSIRLIPAADVRPVVRGKWVNDHNGRYSPLGDNFFCSACKDPSLRAYGKPAKTNFCPSCGAKMDGGQDE